MTRLEVFPCKRDKTPLTRHGHHDATADQATVDYWRYRYPGCLWGAAIPAGVFVLDVDVQHDGDSTLKALIAEHGEILPTRTTSTRSGGTHLWLLTGAPSGAPVRQTIGELGPGLDTRTNPSGYVIVPPSDGYAWISRAPIAPAPAWLLEKLAPREVSKRLDTVSLIEGNRRSSYAEKALASECDIVRSVPVGIGQRNVTLHRAAVKVGTLVGAGVLSEYAAAQALLAATSLPEHEARKTILSGLNFGAANPRQLSA